MREFFWLFKVLFIQTNRRDTGDKKKARKTSIILALCFIPITIYVTAIMGGIGYMVRGHEAASIGFLSSLFSAVAIFIFIAGLSSMLQVMFFSKDTELLLALPVKPIKLFLAKMAVVYTSELFFSVVVCFTVVLAYGVGSGASAIFYILLPVAALLLPFIPLFVISILAFPIMYLLSFFKGKSTFALIALFALFIGFFIGYLLVVTKGMAGGMTAISSALEGGQAAEDFLDSLAGGNKLYPLVFLAAAAFGKISGLNILFFVLSVAGLAVSALLLASIMYTRSVRMQMENTAKDKKKDAMLDTRSVSLETALLKKEFKTLIRETGIAFQSLSGAVIAPVMSLVFGAVFGAMGADSGDAAEYNSIMSLMSMGMSAFFMTMMLGGANYTAHMAFTREGKSFYSNKYLPIPYETILKVKLRFADLVTCAGLLLCVIALLISTAIRGGGIADYISIPLSAGLAAIMAFSLNRFGVKRDLQRPNLKWNNFKEAAKNNFYVVIPTYIGMGIGFAVLIVGIVCGVLASVTGLGDTAAYLIFWIAAYIVAGVAFLLIRLVRFDNAAELFERIEP